MTTFTFSPKYGAALSKEPRVKMAQFGDGYQQRVGDGINTIAREWSLNFEGTKSDIDAIDLFLTTEGGITSFNWTPPSGASGRWLCRNWSPSINEYDNWTLSATFEEMFGE